MAYRRATSARSRTRQPSRARATRRPTGTYSRKATRTTRRAAPARRAPQQTLRIILAHEGALGTSEPLTRPAGAGTVTKPSKARF